MPMVYSALDAVTVVLPEPGPEQQTIMCSHYTSHNNCEHINCEQLFVRSVKMVASPAAC